VGELAKNLKPEKWYAHFWDDIHIYVVFPGKVFKISRNDTSTWQPAIDYGLSLKISSEQLDFIIDE
jgi:hypothetical protein